LEGKNRKSTVLEAGAPALPVGSEFLWRTANLRRLRAALAKSCGRRM